MQLQIGDIVTLSQHGVEVANKCHDPVAPRASYGRVSRIHSGMGVTWFEVNWVVVGEPVKGYYGYRDTELTLSALNVLENVHDIQAW